MKPRSLLLAAALLLPGGFPVPAQAPPRVQLHSLEPSFPVAPPPLPADRGDSLAGRATVARLEPPRHVYGGGPVDFALAVEAPLQTHLRVYADLFQMAGDRLAAPLQRDVPLTPELAFDDRTYRLAAGRLPALPAVQRKTVMLLKLRTALDPAEAAAELSLGLVVYPPEEPGGWKKTLAASLSRHGWRRLAVFGEAAALREFLRARDVRFDDLGEDWPAEFDRRTLYVGETRAPVPPRFADFPGSHAVLFTPLADVALLPRGIYQTADAAGGSLWKVMLPDLFTHIGSDPGAQEILAEIFRRALEPRAHATNETNPDQTPNP